MPCFTNFSLFFTIFSVGLSPFPFWLCLISSWDALIRSLWASESLLHFLITDLISWAFCRALQTDVRSPSLPLNLCISYLVSLLLVLPFSNLFPKQQPKKPKKLVWGSNSHCIQYPNSLIWLGRFFVMCLLLTPLMSSFVPLVCDPFLYCRHSGLLHLASQLLLLLLFFGCAVWLAGS